MKLIFTEDYNEMLEVEKFLMKTFKVKWSNLTLGLPLLKNKIKDDESLKKQGGICILVNDDNVMTWSYGKITKRTADKAEHIEVINAADFLKNK